MSAVEDFIAAFPKLSPEGTRKVFDSLRLRAQRESTGQSWPPPDDSGWPNLRGRPRKASSHLEWLVGTTVEDHPHRPVRASLLRVQRRWVERLAPEVLGQELPRASQIRRAAAERHRRRKRALTL